ncbi:MAG: VWA domain-containing protein [Bacillota bacterium]|nr:VWA domain-containing protein [Bacillota bacterium]
MLFRNAAPASALVLVLLVPLASPSQQKPEQTPYTFQTNTRVVLTDVTVTDAKDNPVKGLPESVFHIFDNHQPQTILSFEEHSDTPPLSALPSGRPGVYTNDYLLHLPPAVNVLLIDIANLEIPEQMYLNDQLTKFLHEEKDLPPLALYLRAGSGCFLVQNFTTDRKLLLEALHKAIPRFPPPGREYLSEFDTLHQIALSLLQVPGRKNILWFSGGSTLYLFPDFLSNTLTAQDAEAWRALYDELDEERIAVFPIDARGLMVGGGFPGSNPVISQHLAMEQTAKATGGEAYFNSNGLKEIAAHLLETDSNYYTLTYSPHELHFDNRWHNVRVSVSTGAYHLGYRSGYFADGSLPATPETTSSTRTRLLANGEKLEVPQFDNQPILFQAAVLPASDPAIASWTKASVTLPALPEKKHTVPFMVRYTVPANAFTARRENGKYSIVFGVVVLAMNGNGTLTERSAQQITLTINHDPQGLPPSISITLDKPVNLSREDQFLTLGIWDMTSSRFGTLQVPLEKSRHKNMGNN